MFSAEQYRAKAAEFRVLLTIILRSQNETREFRNLEQTYTTLAENEEWMAINIDSDSARKNRKNPAGFNEEEQVLRCARISTPSHGGREIRTYECVYGHRECMTIALD